MKSLVFKSKTYYYKVTNDSIRYTKFYSKDVIFRMRFIFFGYLVAKEVFTFEFEIPHDIENPNFSIFEATNLFTLAKDKAQNLKTRKEEIRNGIIIYKE